MNIATLITKLEAIQANMSDEEKEADVEVDIHTCDFCLDYDVDTETGNVSIY